MIFDAISKGGIDTSDATATASDILNTKTAYVDGEKITGEYVPLDTSDATATASDILNTKTAYVDGVKVTGEYVPLDTSDATATASDILNTKTAYVDGVKVTGEYVPLDTSDATATASDILNTKTAYVDGVKVTGSLHKYDTKINDIVQNNDVNLMTFYDPYINMNITYYGNDNSGMTFLNNKFTLLSYYLSIYNNDECTWDGSWNLPYTFSKGSDNSGSKLLIINGELHMLSSTSDSDSKKHYKWSGSGGKNSWTSVSTLPGKPGNRPVIHHALENAIIMFGTESDPTVCYALKDGTSTWYKMEYDNLPYDPVGAQCVSFYVQDTIGSTQDFELLLGGSATGHSRDIYSFEFSENGENSSISFTKDNTHSLPYDFYNGGCVTLRDKNSEYVGFRRVHLFGGGGDPTAHHSFDDHWNWIEHDDIPYSFVNGSTMSVSEWAAGFKVYLGSPINRTQYFQYDAESGECDSYTPFYRQLLSLSLASANNKYKISSPHDGGYITGLASYGNKMHLYDGEYGYWYEYDPIAGGDVTEYDIAEDMIPDTYPYDPFHAMNRPIGNVMYGGVLHEFFNVCDSTNNTYMISHFTWNGSAYTYVSDDTDRFYGTSSVAGCYPRNNVVLYQNEIHIIGVLDAPYDEENPPSTFVHYRFNGTSWIKVCDLTLDTQDASSCLDRIYTIVINNKIHLFITDITVTSNSTHLHYVYDGTAWTRLNDIVPNEYRLIGITNCEGNLHIFLCEDNNYNASQCNEKAYDETNDTWTDLASNSIFYGYSDQGWLQAPFNNMLYVFPNSSTTSIDAPCVYINGQWKRVHDVDTTAIQGLIKLKNI